MRGLSGLDCPTIADATVDVEACPSGFWPESKLFRGTFTLRFVWCTFRLRRAAHDSAWVPAASRPTGGSYVPKSRSKRLSRFEKLERGFWWCIVWCGTWKGRGRRAAVRGPGAGVLSWPAAPVPGPAMASAALGPRYVASIAAKTSRFKPSTSGMTRNACPDGVHVISVWPRSSIMWAHETYIAMSNLRRARSSDVREDTASCPTARIRRRLYEFHTARGSCDG